MSAETFAQVDKRKAIRGVIACHRQGIAMREKSIEVLEAELRQFEVQAEKQQSKFRAAWEQQEKEGRNAH